MSPASSSKGRAFPRYEADVPSVHARRYRARRFGSVDFEPVLQRATRKRATCIFGESSMIRQDSFERSGLSSEGGGGGGRGGEGKRHTEGILPRFCRWKVRRCPRAILHWVHVQGNRATRKTGRRVAAFHRRVFGLVVEARPGKTRRALVASAFGVDRMFLAVCRAHRRHLQLLLREDSGHDAPRAY